MPTITSIKPQKNKKRINIYLDGKFSFGIDLDSFVLFGLKIGQELSEKEITKIVKKSQFQKSLNKLLRFATLRPRSEKEIKNWLKKKDVHISLHKNLFNRLNRLDLIGDYKFAKWWIDQRNSFKPRGKKALFAELRQKGIDREIVLQVLEEIKIDEEKMAKRLLKKKGYKWENLEFRVARQKKYEFLARKGFGWDVIEKVI